MKEIRFLDEARVEFLAAVTYYEQIERGLGVRFRSGDGRQTLVLALVSRHFLAERHAEWRFKVDYGGAVS